MQNSINALIAFALLIGIVGASFAFVEAPRVAWLGIRGSNLTPAIAAQMDLEQQQGFLIFMVESGSPADAAGLRGGNRVVVIDGVEVTLGGDVVIGIDDRTVLVADDIRLVLDQKEIGDNIKFTVIRGTGTREINVILGEMP